MRHVSKRFHGLWLDAATSRQSFNAEPALWSFTAITLPILTAGE